MWGSEVCAVHVSLSPDDILLQNWHNRSLVELHKLCFLTELQVAADVHSFSEQIPNIRAPRARINAICSWRLLVLFARGQQLLCWSGRKEQRGGPALSLYCPRRFSVDFNCCLIQQFPKCVSWIPWYPRPVPRGLWVHFCKGYWEVCFFFD